MTNDQLAYAIYRKRGRLKRYGMSVEEYAALAVLQDFRCAICGWRPDGSTPKKRSLHVDHDHKTGRVRALLCGRCNVTLGQLEEDPALLESMKQYIFRHAELRDALLHRCPVCDSDRPYDIAQGWIEGCCSWRCAEEGR